MKDWLDYRKAHPSTNLLLHAYVEDGKLYLKLADGETRTQHIILSDIEIWWLFGHLHRIYNEVIGDF